MRSMHSDKTENGEISLESESTSKHLPIPDFDLDDYITEPDSSATKGRSPMHIEVKDSKVMANVGVHVKGTDRSERQGDR